MANIGDPITPSVPVVGSAGPQFAADINSILNEIVTRLTVKVPLASVNFNASLDLSGSDLLNVSNIVFSNLAGAPSGSPFSRMAVFGGNLYFVNAAGAVQITTGATLNAAALAGITGDYGGANPAQLNYIAVDTRYNFYANFGTSTWAYARVLGLDIAGGATSSAFARLLWGGGANITLTLPATLPAANQLLSVDNTGAITAGTSTALASNNNITLAGTGTYKHGTKSIYKTPNSYDAIVLSGSLSGTGTTKGVTLSSSTTVLIKLPELPAHYRLVNFSIGFDLAANRNGSTAQLVKYGGGDPATQATTNVGAALSNAGTAKLSVTGLNVQPSAGEGYWVSVTSGGAVGPTVVNMILDFDIP